MATAVRGTAPAAQLDCLSSPQITHNLHNLVSSGWPLFYVLSAFRWGQVSQSPAKRKLQGAGLDEFLLRDAISLQAAIPLAASPSSLRVASNIPGRHIHLRPPTGPGSIRVPIKRRPHIQVHMFSFYCDLVSFCGGPWSCTHPCSCHEANAHPLHPVGN